MAVGTLQQSGDVEAQIIQMIATMGGDVAGTSTAPPISGGKTDLLKALNLALAGFLTPGGSLAVAPSTAVAETIPRAVGAQSVTIATVSGTVYMTAVFIPANTVVNAVNVVTGSTASSNDVTINWAALCNGSRVVLAASANATTQLTPAGYVNTLAMTTPFTTTYSGLYYIAYTVGATTTQPTVVGVASAGTELTKIAPISSGTSSTAGTATPPAVGSTLGAITATANTIYEYLD